MKISCALDLLVFKETPEFISHMFLSLVVSFIFKKKYKKQQQ